MLMWGSHQCSFKPWCLPTVLGLPSCWWLSVLSCTSFKWHVCCLVMQILFFVCHLSIKAQPFLFLPSSAPSPPPSFSSALYWQGTLNVFQVSASYLRARLWQASCPPGLGSLSTPPPPSWVRVLTRALKLGVVCFSLLPSHQWDTYCLSSFWQQIFWHITHPWLSVSSPEQCIWTFSWAS